MAQSAFWAVHKDHNVGYCSKIQQHLNRNLYVLGDRKTEAECEVKVRCRMRGATDLEVYNFRDIDWQRSGKIMLGDKGLVICYSGELTSQLFELAALRSSPLATCPQNCHFAMNPMH